MVIHALLPVLTHLQKPASKSQLMFANGSGGVVVLPALVLVLLLVVVVVLEVVVLVVVVVEVVLDVGLDEVPNVVVPGVAGAKDISSIAISLRKPLPVVPTKRK